MKSAVKAPARALIAPALALLVPAALVPISLAQAHTAPPAAVVPYGPEADYPVTIGDPYVIGGVSYTPSDTLNYDAVGYAHAGSEGSGISGAHHTLPLPCYVEVTALDTGRTILVRLDRRGPMTGKQLVELSPAAWEQLGFAPGADVAVRVRRVNPPETERALLRTGKHAPDRMDTPPGLLTALRRKLGVATPATPDEPPSATLSGAPAAKAVAPSLPAAPKPAPRVAPATPSAASPTPAPRAEPPKAPVAKSVETKTATPTAPVAKPAPKPAAPKPVAKPVAAPTPAHGAPAPAEPVHAAAPHAASGHLVVQVAAFSSRDRAEKAAAQVSGKVEPVGKLWRVRIVASNDEQARAALAKAKQSGYAGAMILHHD